MAITEHTPVVGVQPRLGAAGFAAVLRLKASPALPEAEVGWRAVADQAVDPLFALAVFHHESSFGLDGVCFDHATHSPGNTRTSRTGVGEPIQVPPLGTYVRYPSWTEGWRDLARRLVDPDFVYVQEGRRTVRQIIERFAPPEENNTERYIRIVVDDMRAWLETPDPDRPCRPEAPPPFDGAEKRVGAVVFHPANRPVRVVADGLHRRRFADPAACQTSRAPLARGARFTALYWIEGVSVDGEARWWVTRNGSRVWVGGTAEKPAP